MSIKINEDFEFERYQYGWQLHEYRDGVNPKTKEPTRSKKTTYYPNLEQIANQVLERSCSGVDNFKDMIKVFNQTKTDIKTMCDSVNIS